jgi:hypothetical protein
MYRSDTPFSGHHFGLLFLDTGKMRKEVVLRKNGATDSTSRNILWYRIKSDSGQEAVLPGT